MARVTGLEPATSGVTGRRSNQLSYTRIPCRRRCLREMAGAVKRAIARKHALRRETGRTAGEGNGPIRKTPGQYCKNGGR